MTFHEWLFGGIDNPAIKGQWGPLHITTLVICLALMIGFPLLAKRVRNPEKVKWRIVFTLSMLILFFEIASRVVYLIKLYVLNMPDMKGITLLWIILPKPWCAISCWLLIACVFVKKSFFYDFSSLSALLCSVIYFAYPGVGFNNLYILFDNTYSIVTHALLLTTSITLITLGYAKFKFVDLWKTVLSFVITVIYGLIEIFLLKVQTDPMYFMPDGDIQADILGISYGLYLFLYILLITLLIVTPYMISERVAVRNFFGKLKSKFIKDSTKTGV